MVVGHALLRFSIHFQIFLNSTAIPSHPGAALPKRPPLQVQHARCCLSNNTLAQSDITLTQPDNTQG